MRDDVAALGAAATVAEPLAAYVAFDNVFGLVQAAVAAGMRGYFLGIRIEEIVVLERLFEVQLNSFAGCSGRMRHMQLPAIPSNFQNQNYFHLKRTHLQLRPHHQAGPAQHAPTRSAATLRPP